MRHPGSSSSRRDPSTITSKPATPVIRRASANCATAEPMPGTVFGRWDCFPGGRFFAPVVWYSPSDGDSCDCSLLGHTDGDPDLFSDGAHSNGPKVRVSSGD